MGNKYLITGHSGFVGRYFIEHVLRCEPDAVVLGVDLHLSGLPHLKEVAINLLNKEAVNKVVSDFKPDYLLHLASCSSVAYSWENPSESFINNTNIFLTLLEEIRSGAPDCKVLSIGSSEQYGVVYSSEVPLTESSPLRPVSPYAVARVAQEHLSKVFATGYGMNIVCTRSFNHIGPGQTANFFVSSIIKKIVEYRKNLREYITVGNTDVIRDFLDVRDVVVAYYGLLRNGKNAEVYNICSGRGIVLTDFIDLVKKVTNVDAPVVVDAALKRPVENSIVVGSNEKLAKEIGWKMSYPVEHSITDIFNYWSSKV